MVDTLYALISEDIRIRDPFIVPDREQGLYTMFGTTDTDPWNGPGEGFLAYQSPDLQHWSQPIQVFSPPAGFWGKKNFWAPEVHFYRGRWYLIASFKSEDRCRGVQIFSSDGITGPYLSVSEGPVTPKEWECLDGTLFVDDHGEPWLVFSHEWLQISDGAVCCARLSPDLRKLITSPITLFHGSDAPWVIPSTGEMVIRSGKNYVTDGPFLYHDPAGTLCMLWSSFGKNGYSIGIARSSTGNILGPWEQEPAPKFKNGGHGMLFDALNGTRYLAIHSPNTDKQERLKIIQFNNIKGACL